MELSDFVNIHHGERAWVFGKGPALDVYDFDMAGPIRGCINEAVLCVPEPTYFFAADPRPVRAVAKDFPEDCQAILMDTRAAVAREHGIEDIVEYKGYQQHPEILRLDARSVATNGLLWSSAGTICPAVHFLWLCGIRDIVFVGCSGTGGYAKCLGIPQTGREYSGIRQRVENMMKILEIKYSYIEEGA